MRDVGRLAGCHPSTVSLALRGDLRITPETRERVLDAATQLGYRIHPFVSALSAARRAGRSVDQGVSLIYLNCLPRGYGWRSDQHFGTIYKGALEKAEAQGYSLESIRVGDYQRDIARLNLVLSTRNVQGIVIGPTLAHHELEGIDWSSFSLVTIGYGLQSPLLHRVTEDHHLGMRMAFESCLKAGKRKIGLAFARQHNDMRHDIWLSAYLLEQYKNLNQSERIPVCEHGGEDGEEKRLNWARKYEPEVILADDQVFWKERKFRTMGFAVTESDIDSGVLENNYGIGARAAELLISLVLNNERGVPVSRQTVLVEPSLPAASRVEASLQSS